MKRRAVILLAIVAFIGVLSILRQEPAPPAPPTQPPPDQTLLFKIQGLPQSKNLSCESRSASDLAHFWGVDIAETTFLGKLKPSDNPHRGFVGSPDDPRGGLPPNGYGVYAEPVAELLKSYGLPARAEKDRGLEWLRREVGAGRPVIVWSTYGFQPGPVQTFKDSSGQEFEAVKYEHTYLVVGYTAHGFYAIDAFDGQRKFYTTAEFEAGWNLLGQMAVAADDPKAVHVASGLTGLLSSIGIPVLAFGLLAAAYATWRNGGRLPGLRPQRPVRRRVPRSPTRVSREPDLAERFRSTADELLQDWSRTDENREMDYRLAQTLGALGLAAGMVVMLSVGGFNPFVGIPLVLGCGVIGFVVGLAITRRRS